VAIMFRMKGMPQAQGSEARWFTLHKPGKIATRAPLLQSRYRREARLPQVLFNRSALAV